MRDELQQAWPQPGDTLPELAQPPLAAADFVRYAAASGDHNPLHTDEDEARAAGQPAVIAHGMLVMGLVARVAEAYLGPGRLRAIELRFRAPTLPGEALRCGGHVTAVDREAGELRAEIWARGADGSLKAAGSLIATLPPRSP